MFLLGTAATGIASSIYKKEKSIQLLFLNAVLSMTFCLGKSKLNHNSWVKILNSNLFNPERINIFYWSKRGSAKF